MINTLSGYPLKLHFQIPCVFLVFPPVRRQIFPVTIYLICDYYIHTKLTWQTYQAAKKILGDFRGKFRNIFYLQNQGIYNLSKPNSVCFP